TTKRRFLTLSNSYHGETLGALAVGNVDLYKKIYRPLLMDVITVPSPDCYARPPGESWAQHSRRKFAHMEAALAEHAHEACAVIVEPLVQCAGGMRMYDPVYLTLLREACDRHQVHLIADEIAVGFGRTGTMFACEQARIRPDFMCLSKGLTGGYLPLSAVMTTEAVYAAFYDEYVKLNAFLHSHSFTGNPLGCAAARASLAIFRDDHVLEANRTLAARLGERAGALADHPHEAGARIALTASAARHLRRVLRLRPGQALTLFNGGGGEYAATIEAVHGEKVEVAVCEAQAIERESPLSLTLAQGVSRGERMDLVVQKATELGASSIVPLLTERSVVRLSAPQAARKLKHWRAIAVSPCEQSGRNRLPQLVPPLPLPEFLHPPGASNGGAAGAGAAS